MRIFHDRVAVKRQHNADDKQKFKQEWFLPRLFLEERAEIKGGEVIRRRLGTADQRMGAVLFSRTSALRSLPL